MAPTRAAKPKSATKSSATQRRKSWPKARHIASSEQAILQRIGARRSERIAGAAGNQLSELVSEPELPPKASFLGFPAELRLQIYGHLSDTKLVHVHSRHNTYTWTPCKAVNPDYPLLCLNPKWSGLCTESERCTFKCTSPPEPRGFWGLAATSRLIRHEAVEFFMVETVFSIHPQDVSGWIDWLEENRPKMLQLIKKVTIAGLNNDAYRLSWKVLDLKMSFKNLSAIGLQCNTPMKVWPLAKPLQALVTVPTGLPWMWKNNTSYDWISAIKPTTTVMLEGFIWIRNVESIRSGTDKEQPVSQQLVVRLIREGKEEWYEGEGWEENDYRLESGQPMPLVASGEDAGWRKWWN
ncbi:hypothetical protein GQ44DRAFT_707716 [Phaeosphaeriaceae sp. PMI808]|nr:hypothetical protein GQ44DRAFT_707716 [Phaeosphaeriaceae sp. PMI808]